VNPALYRPGTSDRNIWKSVVDSNEYRLPDSLPADSIVIDIGCNTGAFTYACCQRGAAKVIAFEPDPENYILARKQLKSLIKSSMVEIYPLAVVGSLGSNDFEWRTFSGVVAKDGETNHGGAFLLDKNEGDFGLGQYIVNEPFTVPCISIRAVLQKWPKPHMLKLDCEGSEFEISESLWLLHGMPERIVGEYHPYGARNLGKLVGDLEHKYSVETVPHENSELGLFFAELK
jgi:FkbM family methyltransferase